ncbi:MAG: type IV secretion system DNA-binding domain-containing protein [Gordonia amarae]
MRRQNLNAVTDRETAERDDLLIVGVRPATGTTVRSDVLDSITSMIGMVPDAVLHLSVGRAADGVTGSPTTSVRVHVTGPDGSGELLGELATVLDPYVETTSSRGVVPEVTRLAEHRWILRPEVSRFGFITGENGEVGETTVRAYEWTSENAVAQDDYHRLWGALSTWPDGRVDVTVRSGAQSTFRVTITLVGASQPPLSVRAAVENWFPGLRAVQATGEIAELRCVAADTQLALLMPLPVGDVVPVGLLSGAPAPLPVSMTSGAFGTHDAESVTVRIGFAHTDAHETIDAALGDEELRRHMHVVGATGTGKSTLLADMVHQIAHSGHGALVLDPHGTLVDRIIEELPECAGDRVQVVRVDDLEHVVPLNPLAGGDETQLDTAIADVCEMFYELYDPNRTGIVGPRFEERLGYALRGLALLRGNRASLLDVPIILDHKGMRRALFKKLTDPRVKQWWYNDDRHTKSNEYADLVSWTTCKFERFSASPALRAILGSGADAYDPVGAMDDGRIILVDLAKGQIGSTGARMLGYLLLNRFWVAAMNRNTDRRFHVIVDEAHAVMAGSLVNMLSEGRKFGLSVTVAHQYLDQLAPDIRNGLSGNVGTTVMFRIGGRHADEQAAVMGRQIDTTTLANLPTFNAMVVRTASESVNSRPHTVVVGGKAHPCRRADADGVVHAGWDRVARSVGPIQQFDPDVEYPADDSRSRHISDKKKEESSFLDQWLEKRKQEAESGAASGSGTTG